MDIPPLAFKLIRFAAVALVLITLVHAVGCVSYRALLFQHERTKLAGLQDAAGRQGLALWPTNGPAYRGLVRKADLAGTNGVIVVFHGNAGMALHRRYFIEALEPLGFRVVLAEYPGYGARGGRLTEKALFADGVRTAEEAVKSYGGPLYLWGESMGCAIAAGVAARLTDKPRAVILLTPWNNLPDLAAIHYPRWLARALVRERFDNAANLKAYGGPAAVLMADSDEVVTFNEGLKLYESYGGPKKVWVFPNSGHNSWPNAPGNGWWREVMAFCEQGR